MGERKVLNKYIPPDFDPSLVPRMKKKKDATQEVRMMIPFSMQCSSCSSFMYRGKKFNSKKEVVTGPEGKYLGIQILRFYIKCNTCARPITFLTDPKNHDYKCESGAVRNYEMWNDEAAEKTEQKEEREEEEEIDDMKRLENRVEDSKREMKDMDELDEILAMNKRNGKIDTDGLMERRHGGNNAEELNEDGLSKADEVTTSCTAPVKSFTASF